MLQLTSIHHLLVILTGCCIVQDTFSFQSSHQLIHNRIVRPSLFAIKSPLVASSSPKITKPSISSSITTTTTTTTNNEIISNQKKQKTTTTSFNNENYHNNYNWDFLDAVYLITCDKDDDESSNGESSSSSRLNRVKEVLSSINLLDKTQIMVFDTDDDDRVRGCYTSHLSVIKKAKYDILDDTSNSSDNELWWRNVIPSLETLFNNNDNQNKINNAKEDERQKYVLILEDNLSLSNNFTPKLVSSISSFLNTDDNNDDVNIVHLSYTPFIPNFYIQKQKQSNKQSSDSSNIIQLNCGDQSALGTTAYILSTNGINNLLQHDKLNNGYYGKAIPDVMTEIFTSKRYSIYPIPFVRNFDVKSLVNPQLDTLRTVLFIPSIYAIFENVLVYSGLSTNVLLPLFVVCVGGISVYSIGYTIDTVQLLVNGAATDLSFGSVMLSIVFGLVSIFSLGIIAFGIALAPKPSPANE